MRSQGQWLAGLSNYYVPKQQRGGLQHLYREPDHHPTNNAPVVADVSWLDGTLNEDSRLTLDLLARADGSLMRLLIA